jgi:hypothetical protein
VSLARAWMVIVRRLPIAFVRREPTIAELRKALGTGTERKPPTRTQEPKWSKLRLTRMSVVKRRA